MEVLLVVHMLGCFVYTNKVPVNILKDKKTTWHTCVVVKNWNIHNYSYIGKGFAHHILPKISKVSSKKVLLFII